MTAAEMKNEFLVLYDKITNFEAPGYNDDEISIFLTKAQERVFFNHYNLLDNKFREGFENSEARRKDLRELVRGVSLNTPSTNQNNVLPNGVFFDLPDDCLFVISEEVTIQSEKACDNGKRIEIKPVTHDEYTKNIRNPFKKPSPRLVWRMDYNTQRQELITDGTYDISEYHLRYIKRLTPIIIDNSTIDGVTGPINCELDQIIHKRIVDEAVKIATGTTDPEQYQIKTIEKNEGE